MLFGSIDEQGSPDRTKKHFILKDRQMLKRNAEISMNGDVC